VSSTRALAPQTHAVPRWSLDAAIAGLVVAAIAVGPAISIGIGDRTLPVYASQLAIAVLVVHMGLSGLAHRSFGGMPATTRWLLASVALLAVPLMWTNDPAGVLAYVNFASGTIGGIAIAQVWTAVPRGYSWIDVGYVVFLLGGLAALMGSLSRARSVNTLHQSSMTPWGNSNFVAGCIVVAALIVMARSIRVGRHRKYAIVFGLAAIGVALLTLSRSAAIAACVGAMFFLWSKSGQHLPRRVRPASTASRHADISVLVRPLLRVLAVFIPVLAFIAVDHVTDLRSQLNTQVMRNIDTRFEMFRLAWREFLDNPLTGTGWASFREAAQGTVGESQTFAHNLVLSMLQIGGLLSVPYLVALAVLMYRALRHGGPYTAAIAAAIAVSMAQPFFESTVGNLIILPVGFMAGLSTAMTAEDGGGGVVTPRTVSTRTRPRATRCTTSASQTSGVPQPFSKRQPSGMTHR
jgi:hypothetical protein